MIRYILLALPIFFVMICCKSTQRPVDPKQWTDDQVSSWFDEKEWLGSAKLQPDPSVNKREFAIRYHQQQERWDKAFQYLTNTDLSTVEPGTHEIVGKDVYVIISQYGSKNHDEAKFESHKKYTDIHYVISGTEYIDVQDLSASEVMTPYNEERDIAFYHPEKPVHHLGKPGIFTFCFPDNVHSPGLKVVDSVPVKKAVIKVKN